MQTIRKASRKLAVPAFVAAALTALLLAAPPAHATDQEESQNPCTKSLSTALWAAGISELAATNVSVAAEADGDFAVTWDIPDGSPVPPGAVIGFCLNKEHEDGDECFGCWYKEGLGTDFTPTASSLGEQNRRFLLRPLRHRRVPLLRRHPQIPGQGAAGVPEHQ